MTGWHLVPLFVGTVGAMAFVSTRLWRWYTSSIWQPERAFEAVHLVWSFYGGTGRPPRVFWRKTPDGTWRNLWGQRVAGQTPTADACYVGWRDGMRFSESALCHEFGHAWLMRRGSDGDGSHDDPIFAPSGMVAQAETMLRTHGS